MEIFGISRNCITVDSIPSSEAEDETTSLGWRDSLSDVSSHVFEEFSLLLNNLFHFLQNNGIAKWTYC